MLVWATRPVRGEPVAQKRLVPMPHHTQSFAFSLQDEVTIVEINRPGVINGMSADALGCQYRVVYWNDCQRRSEWVYGWEIKEREKA